MNKYLAAAPGVKLKKNHSEKLTPRCLTNLQEEPRSTTHGKFQIFSAPASSLGHHPLSPAVNSFLKSRMSLSPVQVPPLDRWPQSRRPMQSSSQKGQTTWPTPIIRTTYPTPHSGHFLPLFDEVGRQMFLHSSMNHCPFHWAKASLLTRRMMPLEIQLWQERRWRRWRQLMRYSHSERTTFQIRMKGTRSFRTLNRKDPSWLLSRVERRLFPLFPAKFCPIWEWLMDFSELTWGLWQIRWRREAVVECPD